VDAQGAVTINGAPLHEPYVKTGGNPIWGIAVTLGPGEYFLLEDNRPNSFDSRSFGPIPRANIVGKVVGVVGS
jgi:signal peptidase I